MHRAVAFPNTLGMVFLTALEAAGWSMAQLAHGPLLPLAIRAMREAVPIVAEAEGRPPLGLSLLTREHVLRAGFWLGERFAPFPLEPYLQKHFTKVGAQTRLMVTSLFGRGRAQGQPVAALGELIERVPPISSH